MKAGFILSVSIGSAIICGIWTWLGLLGATAYPEYFAVWAGFVGCTSYFVAGCGRNGFIRSLVSNYSGVLIGTTIVLLGNAYPGIVPAAICTGFFSGVICFITHCDLTKFSTCTFMGGFSLFAATTYSEAGGNPNWKMLLICLLLGNVVGLSCDLLGGFIYKTFFAGKSDKDDWVILKLKD